MADRFTPLLGLAVSLAVVAAVVFGAIGLANPAFAKIAPPAGDSLAGDVFYPQDDEEDEEDKASLTAEGRSRAVVLTYAPTATSTVPVPTWEFRYAEQEESYPSTWMAVGAVDASLMHTVDNLTNGITYKFQARTVNDQNEETERADATATPSQPPDGTTRLTATTDADEAMLEWSWTKTAGSPDPTGWQYQQEANGDWMDIPGGADVREHTVTGLTGGTDYSFAVRPVVGTTPPVTSSDAISDSEEVSTEAAPFTLEGDSSTPGSNTKYTITFQADADRTSGIDDIVVEMEDYGFPSRIDAEDVSIRVVGAYDKDGNIDNSIMSDAYRTVVATPADVSVDGEELTITLKNAADDFVDEIKEGYEVTIVIRQSAGITNPTEPGDSAGASVEWGSQEFTTTEQTILRKVTLSEEDGGRGDMVTATGKGFKNGTTLTFWLEDPSEAPNGMQDSDEFVLCSAEVNSDDVGSCDFEVTNPPFLGGNNYINASDGRNQTDERDYPADYDTVEAGDDDRQFELTASVSVAPDGGSPGEVILVQLTDFPVNSAIDEVLLARSIKLGVGGTTDSTGSANFKITIPDNAPEGLQDLRITVGDVDDNTNITISGPTVDATPSEVVANQRVSLVGTGFNPRARVCCGDQEGDDTADPSISIGGYVIPDEFINGGDPVRVDNGGNWSAAVDLPLNSATTAEGSREIRVTDSEGRTGKLTVSVKAREVTITPDTGRVGTMAVVRGENFPSKNDDGESFNVVVIYDAGNNKQTTVTAVPDASGRFETDLRIPTTAGIPSTNTVKVEFEDSDGVNVVTTVTHDVPEGAISLSQTSGAPGAVVSVSGVGFKAFVPVQEVKVGAIEVTPSPTPSTDAQGGLEFEITIPGLDTGIQTIEVQVSGTTASVGFTVTGGSGRGAATPVMEGASNMGDNFVRSFHFNNDNKEWTFYDPDAGDASSQEHFIAGETYWILINESQEAILNGETRNLTCVGGNCWNQVVW